MKPTAQIISWILQLTIITLLAPAAYAKLTAHPDAVALFTTLEMEPAGRYIIGFLEAATCALLLNPNSAVHGAILSLGIMIGALIAHLSKIGFDNMFYFSLILIITSSAIIYLRRKQIKSIARMLN